MRYVMLTLIALSFPLFWNLLSQNPHRRPLAVAALVAMLFLNGEIGIQAFLYGWPGWQGTVKGFGLSFVDSLALALLLTRHSKQQKLPLIGFLLFYGIPLTVSIIPSQVPMAAVFSVWQYGRIVLLFFALGFECRRRDARDSLLGGLCVGIMIQAAYVVQQKAGGVVQAPGTMGHQNVLGMVTEASLMPLVAALLAGDKRILIKIGVLAALGVVAMGGSRAALGLTAGGLAVLLILSFIRHATLTKAKVLGLACITLMAITPLAFQTLNKRFGDTSVFTDEEVRASLERSAILIASDHILGAGANQFVVISNTKGYAQRAGVGGFGGNLARPVHNAYLLARAETGWAGEIALFMMLLIPIYRGLRFSYGLRSGTSGEIVLGSSVAIGLIAIHSNYEFALMTFPVFALFAVNAAVIVGQIAAHHASNISGQNRSFSRRTTNSVSPSH